MAVSEEECVRHLAHLDHIQPNCTKLAYIALILAAERGNFQSKAKLKGVLHEVQFWRGDKQPFAMSVNKYKGMLFYVHEQVSGQYRQRIAETAAGLREYRQGSLEEDHYRVETYADAILLANVAFGLNRKP